MPNFKNRPATKWIIILLTFVLTLILPSANLLASPDDAGGIYADDTAYDKYPNDKNNSTADDDFEGDDLAEAAVFEDIIPFGAGRQIPAADFANFAVSLRRGSEDLPPTGFVFQPGQYSLQIDFAIRNGVAINPGDFFDLSMSISGVDFNIDIGTRDLGNGISAQLTRNGPDIDIRIIFDEESHADLNNITGIVYLSFNLAFDEVASDIIWTITGATGSTGTWAGEAGPNPPPYPGFWPPPPGLSKAGWQQQGGSGVFTWEAFFNHQGLSANAFFAQYGAPTAPASIRITDTMNEHHSLIPFGPTIIIGDFINADHVYIASVNLRLVLEYFQQAASDPQIQEQIRWVVPDITDFSRYATINTTALGGYQIDHFINRFINQIRLTSPTPPSAPAGMVRPVNVPIQLTGQGFYFDLPTSYLENSIVFVRYNSMVHFDAPVGAPIRNEISFSGEGIREEYFTVNWIYWGGWSGISGNNTQISILKRDPDNPAANMSGAVFTVERQNGTFGTNQGADAAGIIRIITNDQGIATTRFGLGSFNSEEVFIIREEVAPNGYQRYTGEIRLSIDPGDNFRITLLNNYTSSPFQLDEATAQLILDNTPLNSGGGNGNGGGGSGGNNGGSSGGGGNGGSSGGGNDGNNGSGSSDGDIIATIPDTNIPLADLTDMADNFIADTIPIAHKDVPRTGDTIYLWLALAALAISGLLFLSSSKTLKH